MVSEYTDSVYDLDEDINPADRVRNWIKALCTNKNLKIRVTEQIVDHTMINPLYDGGIPSDATGSGIECTTQEQYVHGGPAYDGNEIPRHAWSIFGNPGSPHRKEMVDALLHDFETGNLHTLELTGSDPYTYDGSMRTILVSDNKRICLFIVRIMEKGLWLERRQRNRRNQEKGSSFSYESDDPFDHHPNYERKAVKPKKPKTKRQRKGKPCLYHPQGRVEMASD